MNPIKFYRVESLPETGEVGSVYFVHGEVPSLYVQTENGPESYSAVRSVTMTVPTGLVVSGTPLTNSGTIAIGFEDGYNIPSISQQTTWSNKQDAMTAITTEEIDAICG